MCGRAGEEYRCEMSWGGVMREGQVWEGLGRRSNEGGAGVGRAGEEE